MFAKMQHFQSYLKTLRKEKLKLFGRQAQNLQYNNFQKR